MTKYSDTQHKAIKAYRIGKKTIQLQYTVDEYDLIVKHCAKLGLPIATWIKALIKDAIHKDRNGD